MNLNLGHFLPAVIAVVAALLLIVTNRLWVRLFGVVIIPEDSIGIINKKFVLFGSNRTLPDGAIIALKGEAGYQADTLAPGLHFGFWPWQYEVNRVKFIEIPEGKLGIVEAIDGKPMEQGKVLARGVECDAFQNARAFLTQGGERGPQINFISPGKWRINTTIFKVTTVPALDIEDNMVGIVTTKEGKGLEKGEIAGKEVPDHNNFQNGQAFVNNGGYKGLQEQVILAGRWFINPMFASVELKPMTEVEIAHVGVVIAFVGEAGVDVTGEVFKHGNLVSKGEKGVWVEPLDPGKYPINPYTHRVESVPTANVVLNWATGKNESHMLDKNLSTITVRSSDGFTFNLDVSQIIHIPRNDAPKVIARFGSMTNLVTQVLEPTIGNYFRNSAQESDVIAFLKQRQERQADAKTKITTALTEYNVGAVDTLIGDITPPDALMETLTARKIAQEQKETFRTQTDAQTEAQKLAQARALADTQPQVVNAERQVAIAEFQANARIKAAEGEASSKKTIATADAMVLETVGKAEGEKIKAIGTAEADVIKLKIASMESGNYAMIEVTRALAESGNKLVPEIIAGGGGEGKNGGTLVDVLLAQLIASSMKNGNGTHPEAPVSAAAVAVSEGSEAGASRLEGLEDSDDK